MSAVAMRVETTESSVIAPSPQSRPSPGTYVAPYKWNKGVSGNPGGRSRRFFEVQHAAQEKSVQAIEKLGLLMSCGDERVELMAASAILDRAFGKPKEQKADDAGGIRPDLSALAPGDLAALRAIMGKLTLPAEPGPAPEAATAG